MPRRRDDADLWENEELYFEEEEIPDLEEAIARETARGLSRKARKQAREKEQEAYRLGYEEGLRESMRADRSPGRGKRRRKPDRGGRTGLFVVVLILLVPVILYVVLQLRRVTGPEDIAVEDSISAEAKNNAAMADYLTLAIFGLDSREGNLDAGDNRSDVIMIASLNKKTGELALASVFRDTYLLVGDQGYAKANAAFAYGGPAQAVRMLNMNFDLAITDYAAVGFEGLAVIVDAVGGVEIDVQADELEHLNNYSMTMSEELGRTFVPLAGPGHQLLNGVQAAAYCRIRYTRGDDFRRTERQRTVLTQVGKRARENPLRVLRSVGDLLRVVRTSMNWKEIIMLAPVALKLKLKDTAGFPLENMRYPLTINQQACVVPVTLADVAASLHAYLYGEENYVPGARVQEINARIRQDTGL